MYSDTGAGSEPLPPAQLAIAMLLQGYLGLSDADAVEASVLDLRWQLVLGCLGTTEPPFSQGTLQGFRERLIAHDMDRRILERTIELAKRTKEFDWKKLPKTLHVAIDSAPLEGAGRVEDTINLLAHAARKVVVCAAGLLHWPVERLCQEARATLLLAPSIKAALDRDSSDPVQKAAAVKSLVFELENLIERGCPLVIIACNTGIFRRIRQLLPQYDFIYLGDNARTACTPSRRSDCRRAAPSHDRGRPRLAGSGRS
jgi:hypothetical protein